jgi:hypothetical protein
VYWPQPQLSTTCVVSRCVQIITIEISLVMLGAAEAQPSGEGPAVCQKKHLVILSEAKDLLFAYGL